MWERETPIPMHTTLSPQFVAFIFVAFFVCPFLCLPFSFACRFLSLACMLSFLLVCPFHYMVFGITVFQLLRINTRNVYYITKSLPFVISRRLSHNATRVYPNFYKYLWMRVCKLNFPKAFPCRYFPIKNLQHWHSTFHFSVGMNIFGNMILWYVQIMDLVTN